MTGISKSENQETATSGMQSVQMQGKARNVSHAKNPKPYVVVRNPGTDDEDEVADFATFREAALFMYELEQVEYTTEQDPFEHWDVMKRLDDGTLTEF